MHLGYHELRNMLTKFREERDKRKAAGAGAGVVVGSAAAGAAGTRGEYRGGRGEEYRDRERDRGYERHSSSRYE